MNNQSSNNPPNSILTNQEASSDMQKKENKKEQSETTNKKAVNNIELPSNVLSGTSSVTQNHISNLRDKFLNLELNNLKSYGYYYGVYCVPRHFKPHIWDGVIIIRSGLYKNGKFKFFMEFPRGFPKNKPELYFTTKVYHPLINSETGQLDTKTLSPEWKNNSTISYNLFAWLKSIFHDTTYLQVTDSFNSKAGVNFLEKIEEFYEKVCKSVDQSEKDLFENDPTDGLKFNTYNSVHEEILKKLSDVASNKEIPESLRVNQFLDSLLKCHKNPM